METTDLWYFLLYSVKQKHFVYWAASEYCSLNLAYLHPLKMTVQVCVWQQQAGSVIFHFHSQRQ